MRYSHGNLPNASTGLVTAGAAAPAKGLRPNVQRTRGNTGDKIRRSPPGACSRRTRRSPRRSNRPRTTQPPTPSGKQPQGGRPPEPIANPRFFVKRRPVPVTLLRLRSTRPCSRRSTLALPATTPPDPPARHSTPPAVPAPSRGPASRAPRLPEPGRPCPSLTSRRDCRSPRLRGGAMVATHGPFPCLPFALTVTKSALHSSFGSVTSRRFLSSPRVLLF